MSPGISDDGRIVAFYGDLSVSGAARLGPGLDPGPGIFVSVPNLGGGRIIGRIAGIAGNGYLDPGETYRDINGNGRFDQGTETDEGTITAFEADTRVAIAPAVGGASVVYIGIDSGGRKGIFSARVTLMPSVQPAPPESIKVADTTQVVQVGQRIHRNGFTPGAALDVTIKDLEIYDAVNKAGQIAFWANTDVGPQIVRANPLRTPVLIVPGVGGVLPKEGQFKPWLEQRGFPPELMTVDPLARVYDDLIKTLENAGYRDGKDLFVVDYDWRLLPGPIDGTVDGHVGGLDAASITAGNYRYGVDYLGHYLKLAMDSWAERFPSTALDAVNVIAHSTGGLVARTYIQSDAYNGSLDDGRRLPRINDFEMIGVPNRGAVRPWSPLNNNWWLPTSIDDLIGSSYILPGLLRAAWRKVSAGETIAGPDGPITLANVGGSENAFITRYVPTLRSLLATYNFLDLNGDGNYTNTNSDPRLGNQSLTDLNGGTDPNSFAGIIAGGGGQVNDIYGFGKSTPVNSVLVQAGPFQAGEPLKTFNQLGPEFANSNYFRDIRTLEGDGAVPLRSSFEPFAQDARVNTSPHFNDHLALLDDVDVQREILERFGYLVDTSQIARGTSTHYFNLARVGQLSYFIDPVEAVLTDANGRRQGFTRATGLLNEIPDGVYVGGVDGFGIIFGSVATPMKLDLYGLDASYNVFLSGASGEDKFVGFSDAGYLASGDKKSFDLTFSTITNPILTVAGVSIDDGGIQRSMVRSQTITFSGLADVDLGAFEVRTQEGVPVGLNVARSDVAGRTQVVLTYTGPDIIGGSLPDGNYTLIIHGDKVHDRVSGTNLDGDGDGKAGGDHSETFFRLFGDTNGDRNVDNLDYYRFRSTFGLKANETTFLGFLDFDGNGIIDQLDLIEFTKRRNKRLAP